LAVRGGNLPPRRAHPNRTPFGGGVVRSVAGLVARPNGPVARSTLISTESGRINRFRPTKCFQHFFQPLPPANCRCVRPPTRCGRAHSRCRRATTRWHPALSRCAPATTLCPLAPIQWPVATLRCPCATTVCAPAPGRCPTATAQCAPPPSRLPELWQITKANEGNEGVGK
jgi:hypothetical protein